jgi:hypothetical protein
MLASAAWLAGLDELVPGSGGVAGFSRINGLSSWMRSTWGVVLILLLPLGVLAAGGSIAISRRRA